MNFQVPEKEKAMNEAEKQLDLAADLLSIAAGFTSKMHDALTDIPSKGWSSWFRDTDRKNAATDLKKAQEQQALRQAARDKAELAFHQAVDAYLDAVRSQSIADNAAAEADQAARAEVKAAAARILPTDQIEIVGKRSVRKLETLTAREQKLRTDKASVNADLRAAEILGFSGTVAE